MSDSGGDGAMSDDAKPVALRALRSRALQLAQAINRAELAQAQLAIAMNAADRAGASQADVDQQVRLACEGHEGAWEALERLRIVGNAS